VNLVDLRFDFDDYQLYYLSFQEEKRKLDQEMFRSRHQELLNKLREFYSRMMKVIESLGFEAFCTLEELIGLNTNNDLLLRLRVQANPTF
jgi:hypothetical protein